MRKSVRGLPAPVLVAVLVTSLGAGTASAVPEPVGEVLTWGTASVAKVPIPEEARSGVTAVAAGQIHNMVLKDGKVIVWNYNGQGQMDVSVEAKAGGIKQISSTYYHNLVLR